MAANAVVRPTSGGTPASPAYASATGTITTHEVSAAIRSGRSQARG